MLADPTKTAFETTSTPEELAVGEALRTAAKTISQ